MKTKIVITIMILVLISFFCFPTISKSQNDLGPVISLSFDDGNLNQYTAAWPLMKERGVVGTFYVITDFISSSSKMNWSDLIDLQKNGNEIGSHGVTHSRFTELTEVEIRDECRLSKETLESQLGHVVNNFAYPFGASNETIDEIVNDYYRSGRYGGGLMDLPVTTFHIHHNGWDWSLDQYKEVVDNAYSTKKWAVLNFHSIGGDITGGAWITAEDFAELLDYIISKGIEILTVNQALNIGKFELEYIEIADYYDDRKAVVTVTGDDWGMYSDINPYFDDFCEMFTSKNIYFTGGIVTAGSVNWTQIQYWLDQGFLEAASHSRTHKHIPYDDYNSEIAGSKQDIIDNLVLPDDYLYGGSEYVYSWLEPYGESDPTVRQMLGQQNYLVDRLVGLDDYWATWNSTDRLFDRVGYSIRMEESWGITDIDTLNSKFDEIYDGGGIYQIFTHPRNLDYSDGEYVDLHTDYIGNREDVWYVSFGHLYLYHWIDSQNIVQVSSTAEDNVFQINIDSTDRENYGAKYPITYVFDIPVDWTDISVNYRFRETDAWAPMTTKTSSDFYNGIDAVRFDYANHKAYVSIGFNDISNDIYLQLLPQDSQPDVHMFDFGSSGSPVEAGYERVTESTAYLASLGYGWSSTSGLTPRDRGAPDNLRRDLVFSPADHTFNVDVPGGDYQVTVIIGDQDYMHDNIDVLAEGNLVIDDLTVAAGNFIETTFTVTVIDGQLNIRLHDDGGTDLNWVINSILIQNS